MMVRVLSIVFVLLNYFSITAYIPSDKDCIPIVYATDDKYVMPTIVSMESAVRSMSDTSFYEFTILVPNEFKQENINLTQSSPASVYSPAQFFRFSQGYRYILPLLSILLFS